MFNKEGAAYQRSVLICCLFSAGSRGRCSIFVATRRRCHDLLEAYAKFGPDTVGIAEALDIKEHEVDPPHQHEDESRSVRPDGMPDGDFEHSPASGTRL
ncbi:hypothetical protein GOA99_05415 [Sinorhizobium meliloti]|nr:hypothetical protein [Sinorhizobium meliloti]MDW9497514.1 hypothetical protein [Sinorhizobium meliloti]MDW9562470.1 hypothetical protein [Sinorhizobium meliloti]MDW9688333.1 hypothetical protein [Sinorhizobium meliloti]MDW9814175.1 hypothetical protein [Sinorhizobium meliloti]